MSLLEVMEEDPRFLQEQLITYLGNKRTLLPFIGRALKIVQKRIGRSRIDMLDLFSGTGVVARYFKQFSRHLIVNDLETYSRITNACYLTNRSDVDHEMLSETLDQIRHAIAQHISPGFIEQLYSPPDEHAIRPDDRVFYTRKNARYLDAARQAIARVDENLQQYFLAPLLAAASVHANTSGVFKGFYKNENGVGQFGGSGKDALSRILSPIKLRMPVFSQFECDVSIYQADANALVSTLPDVDLAYLDPPYNQHPYGSNYFMLNLICDYHPPAAMSRVSGIPPNWNRSQYNRRAHAADALFDLIAKCPAKFILISYNSEGFITQDRLFDGLRHYGKLRVMRTQYNTFRGSRNLAARAKHVVEFLYLLEKRG